MNRSILSGFLLLAATVVFASWRPVSAQPPTVGDRFERVDQNGDGKITAEELPRPGLFQRLDRNGDGVIEQQEVFPDSTRRSERDAKREVIVTFDVAYGDHPSQRLDIYQPSGVSDAPVMVYIHGGGWQRGDKRSVGEKVNFFCGRGWLFVSINYRLLPDGKHPANVDDVARALAWVHDRAKDYGGSPDHLFVMGHSAGAHLAALVATHPKPLRRAGKSLAILRGAIALDTNAYDIAKLVQSRASDFYRSVFGDDPSRWKDASPKHHIAADTDIPPFLICYSRGLGNRSNPDRPDQANAFAEALRAAGIPAKVIDGSDRSHGDINAWFGRQDDKQVTGEAARFLDGLLSN